MNTELASLVSLLGLIFLASFVMIVAFIGAVILLSRKKS